MTIKIIKIAISRYLVKNKFNSIITAFNILKKNNQDITFKNYSIDKQYITFLFGHDEKNLKFKLYKGILIYYYDILPDEKIPDIN